MQITTESCALIGLTAAGLLLSVRLLRQGSGGRGLPGCGAGSGCDAVTRSRWAKWLGVPVAGPAAVLYAVLLASLMAPGGFGHAATGLRLAAAPLLAAAAAWFVALQWLVLRRLCLYCLLLHGIGVAVAAAFALGLPGGEARFAYAGMPAGELLVVLSISAAGTAALVLGQVLVEPRTYVVQAASGGGLPVGGREAVAPLRSAAADGRAVLDSCDLAVPDNGRAVTPGFGQANGKPTPAAPSNPRPIATSEEANPYSGRRIVTVGRVPLRGGLWPTVGLPEAREVLVFLFCYTCANCRHLHRLLTEAMERDPERMALMLMPVPTDPGCNPHVRHCGPEHADACAYARLALSLWGADWSKYAEFDRYLFDSDRPPAMASARGRAEALVGRRLGDPREPSAAVDRLIGMGVSLHKSTGADLTPALLMPRNYLAGHVPTGAKLEEILEREIGAAHAARGSKEDQCGPGPRVLLDRRSLAG